MASMAWSVNQLTYDLGPDSEGHTDIVISIDWLLTGTSDESEHTVKWAGISKVKWEEGDDWVPYDEITEEQAVQWAQDQINNQGAEPQDYVAVMEAQLAAQLAKLDHPTQEIARPGDLPWNEGD